MEVQKMLKVAANVGVFIFITFL